MDDKEKGLQKDDECSEKTGPCADSEEQKSAEGQQKPEQCTGETGTSEISMEELKRTEKDLSEEINVCADEESQEKKKET